MKRDYYPMRIVYIRKLYFTRALPASRNEDDTLTRLGERAGQNGPPAVRDETFLICRDSFKHIPSYPTLLQLCNLTDQKKSKFRSHIDRRAEQNGPCSISD